MLRMHANTKPKTHIQDTSISMSVGSEATIYASQTNSVQYRGAWLAANKAIIMGGKGNTDLWMHLVEDNAGTPNTLDSEQLTYTSPSVTSRFGQVVVDQTNGIIFAAHCGRQSSGADDEKIQCWSCTVTSDVITEHANSIITPHAAADSIRSLGVTFIGDTGTASYFATSYARENSGSFYLGVQIWEVNHSTKAIVVKDNYLSAAQGTDYLDDDDNICDCAGIKEWEFVVGLQGGRTLHFSYDQGTDALTLERTLDTFTNSDTGMFFTGRKDSIFNEWGPAAVFSINGTSGTGNDDGFLEFIDLGGKTGNELQVFNNHARGSLVVPAGNVCMGYCADGTTQYVAAVTQEYDAGGVYDSYLSIAVIDSASHIIIGLTQLDLNDATDTNGVHICHLDDGKFLMYYRKDDATDYATGRIVTITLT